MNLILHGFDIRQPSGIVRAIIQVVETVNGQDILLYEDTVTLTSARARQKFIAYVVAHFQAQMNGTDPANFEPRLLELRQEAEAIHQQQQAAAAAQAQPHAIAWMDRLLRTKDGVPHETLGNIILALEHIAPWSTLCWYDVVRDLPMVDDEELSDDKITQASLTIERTTGMHMRSRHLVPNALTHLCHRQPRDLLQQWLNNLPEWDKTPRLRSWLQTYAHAPDGAYGEDVSRLLIVSMVVRAFEPGCLYRFVVILEGPENAGKTSLVRSIATPEWYRELSHGLEGKEAHMRIKRAWVAELSDLASMRATEEARLKSFFTMREDTYIPKFSNFEVSHKRRTVFVGTVNPEGENRYLNGQTGNTRYLPIPVENIDIKGFEQARTQIFAEALKDYRDRLQDWWELDSDSSASAKEVREERRQRSVYEDGLGDWLEQNKRKRTNITWWEEIASGYLVLQKRDWTNRQPMMEVAKALKALGWEKGKRMRLKNGPLIVPWVQTPTWFARRKIRAPRRTKRP